MKQLFNSIITLTLMLAMSLSFFSCLQENDLSDSDIICINCAKEFIVLWEAWDAYAKEFDKKIELGEFIFDSQQQEDEARLRWALDDEEQRLQKLTDLRTANLGCLSIDRPEVMYEYASPKWQKFKK